MTPNFEARDLFISLTILAALLVTALMMQGDLRRRKIRANAYVVTALAFCGGLLFALLPIHAELFWAWQLPGEILAVIILAWRKKISILEFLDACSPAAAAGFTVLQFAHFIPFAVRQRGHVSIGALLISISWVIVCAAIAAFLWRMGKKAALGPKPAGEIFSFYLLLTSAAWLAFDFGGKPPKAFFDLSILHIQSLIAFVIGGILLWWILARYHKVAREHRVLQHVAERGEILQPEYSQPTPECPHPERWRMYDSMTAEFEVLDFLKALVVATKPELVVETGTFLGTSTLRIAEGLRENGFGRVITCENDPKVFEEAKKRFEKSGLADWIELRNESSLEMKIEGTIDLLYCDSDLPLRETEVRWFLPQINPNGLILMHDASSSLEIVRKGALNLEREGLISVVLLPTPRGLVIAQKREGRA
jgi:predicted O-methyltransferase YrrM